MQRGAYEAIYLGKPVITSNFGVLRSNFPIGTVFVNNDVDSIADGIKEMMRNGARYEAEARQLGGQKRYRWTANLQQLESLL
jgi:glycosyltransferase involved in cell wall biosynthesis